jgi:hypothetical protein
MSSHGVGSLTLEEGTVIAKNYIEMLGEKLISARDIYGNEALNFSHRECPVAPSENC